jgi:predicted Rdx family selenoprotein
MTTMRLCPECRTELYEWVMGEFKPPYEDMNVVWKRCPSCGWDERQELKRKIREQLDNDRDAYS